MVCCSVPFELVEDGDLLVLIERMLHLRGLDTVRISKVKGHADEVMVLHGRVREDDKIGNNAADEAADFGRRRVGNTARRNLSGVCSRWYPVLLDLRLRGLDTVRIAKVKGHVDEGVVLDGRVREIDRLGNDAADEAADFGRRVGNAVIDARRNLSGVCGRWYPVVLDLHRFFIAIARAVVNQDGRSGVAPDPLVWSAGARPKTPSALCCSGSCFSARAAWILGFRLGYCPFFCYRG